LNTSYENALSLPKPNLFSIAVYEQTGATLVTSSKWVYVKELSFITKNLDLGYLHPSSRKELLRFCDQVKAGDKAYGKKLYVSRLKSRRSIPEEALMEKFFLSEGFKVIYAEDFSLKEQISIFRNATLVVAVHGAGITNLVWAEKCKLVELMPINRINRCFEWQSYVCGHEYKRVYFDEENFSITSILNEIRPLIA
jgi:capsular polysaccharide biosynthesis protein